MDIRKGILGEILGSARKENNNQISYDCPICSNKKGLLEGDGKGNLEVNLSKEVYNCWSCPPEEKNHGTIQKLIFKFGSKEHLKNYLLFKGIFPDNEDEKELIKLDLPNDIIPLWENKNNRAYQYLKSRGISDDTIFKWKMYACFSGKYKNRVIVPSYDKDNKLNFFITRSFINHRLKYLNPKVPKDNIIFGENLINWDSTLYIVEGVFDAITLPNSLPLLGKSMSEKIKSEIFDKSNGKIIIILDSDAEYNMYKIYNDLNFGRLKGRIKMVKLINKDLSDINQKYGNKGVLDVVRENFDDEITF
jgi:hypothetical protein